MQSRGVFRTLSNIYDGVFFEKIANSFKGVNYFCKSTPSKMFDEFLNVSLQYDT